MPQFTVEITQRLHEFAHIVVEAATAEDAHDEAVAIAEGERPRSVEGSDWRRDLDDIGPSIVTGCWRGDEAYPSDVSLACDVPNSTAADLGGSIAAAPAGVDRCRDGKGSSAPVAISRPAERLRAAFAKWKAERL